MLTAHHWRQFEAVVGVGLGRKPSEEFLRPFRAAAFAGEVPWLDPDAGLSAQSKQFLLADMARTASTAAELAATMRAFDDSLTSRGQAWITADAGDILIYRARTRQLPSGWGEALTGIGGSDRPSGSYWSRAILRAGGFKSPEPEIDDAELDYTPG